MTEYRTLTSTRLVGFAVLVRSPSFTEGAIMRFNPPPNWPQPRAGWVPPPGWKPDPSWPQPPLGWPLWIADDEFVTAPYPAVASRAQSTQPWHQRTRNVVLFLIFFFPVGLVLLWLRPDWSVRRRGIITGVVGIAVILALASPKPPPTTTTVLSSTAGGTASSQPAAPSTVATQTPTPVPSALSVTTTPAPAYTPPAPVPTTEAPQAPQPVQTSAQTQGCTPKTNSGKCYTPGEYCRDTDHNASGVDADGDAITCEDKDGWRWERV